MGKDLNGKELGRGLSQRPDGRYMGRAQVEGRSIVLYNWKLRDLKADLYQAIDEAKRSTLAADLDIKSITLNGVTPLFIKYNELLVSNSYSELLVPPYGVGDTAYPLIKLSIS